MTTVDLSARRRFEGGFGGLELSFNVANLFNTYPSKIATSSATAEPYDSTNYSILGRTVSIRASIKW